MNALPVGTPCFLTGLKEHAQLLGRVVEIVAGPMRLPDACGDWYSVHAEWALEMFPGGALAPRANLLPITPPAQRSTRVTEKLEV